MGTATVALTAEGLLRRLEWQVLRRLDGRLQGNHRSAFRGVGVDINDLRDYEVGDDVRHIDWNVTARMDSPFVRQYLEDREVTAWLLADRSPSMTFGPLQRPKDLVLAELATALARLVGRNGNRVGAVLFSNTIEATIRPRGGRNQTLRIARALLEPVPAGRGATDLGVLLRAADSMVRRRSLIVLLSDFIGPDGWQRPLGVLAQRHDVVAIRLSDPRESELPDAGLVVFEDPETGDQIVVDTSDAELHQRMAVAVAERDRALRDATAQAGVQLVTISTDTDLVDALVQVTTARRFSRAR